LLRWASEDALFNIQTAFKGVMTNLPVPVIGAIVNFIVFPLTKPYHGPDDRLGHKVARLLLAPSPTLDRLSRGIYFNDLPDDATGRIERAFRLVLKTTGIERKLRDARKAGQLVANDDAIAEEALQKNIIGEADFELLQETRQAVRNAILVDEFSCPGWKLETP